MQLVLTHSLRCLLLVHLLLCSLCPFALAQTAAQAAGPATDPEDAKGKDAPARSVPDPGVITTRQAITPAGVQAIFESRVYGVAFSESNDQVYAVGTSREGALIYKLDWRTNKVVQLSRTKAYPGIQAIALDAATHRVLMSGEVPGDEKGKPSSSIGVVAVNGEGAKVLIDHLGSNAVGGIAVSGNGRFAVVPLTFDDQAAILDLNSGALQSKVRTGVAPFGAVVNREGTAGYVSNLGGRFPQSADQTATTGSEENSDRAVVDGRGIASSGTVSRLDLATGMVTASISVGLHPTSLAWDEARNRLYVANSNSDTVSVIDTAKNAVVEQIALQPFARPVAGVAPEALVLSRDGSHLYVACAGMNAVAVVAVAGKSSRIEGLIPTGWYPSDIALSPDGTTLAVSTLLGVGSGWKTAPVESFSKRYGLHLEPGPTRRYVHSYRGTLHLISIPDAAQLEGYTAAVAENNHLAPAGSLAEPVARKEKQAPLPVPQRAGDPSPIEHIVYIIKENRSYDQVFGDLGEGNGDPSLVTYGEDVAPNQRKLAREFVLLDNFYANGGNSGDGHQWVTQASETDYTLWPAYGGRSYPKNGDDPLAYANSGFLWDNALKNRKTFADFGEFVGYIPKMQLKERMKLLDEYKSGSDFAGRFSTVAPISALNQWVVKDYPAYGLQCPDVVRARIFLENLKQWESSGKMPNLVMMQLPSDHTAGTTPGLSTPKAEIADNDWAVGQVVEGLSHSPFWKSTLIFVVEDDAQDGLDHIDGHRTVALAIGPYIRRHSVDSTFYAQTSMVKTIELILGLAPMSLFDRIANDMRNSFQATPDLTSYTAIEPQQSIYEANPPLHSLSGQARQDAIASMHMNFLVPDDAPTDQLNALLWRNAKGPDEKLPEAKKAWFQPSGPPVRKDGMDRD